MPKAWRARPIDEEFTDADRKDIAKELKAPVDRVAFTEHLTSSKETVRSPGHVVGHTLTGTFGPGEEYDPTRDPKEVAREAARITGEEIARAFANQKGA